MEPYRTLQPDAPHSPLTEYGRQKARAEAGFSRRMERGMPAAILRLAKVVFARYAVASRLESTSLQPVMPIRAFSDMTMAPVENRDGRAMRSHAMMKDVCTRGLPAHGTARPLVLGDRAPHGMELGVDRSLVGEGTTVEAGLPKGSGRMHTTLDSSRLATSTELAPPDVLAVVNSVSPRKDEKTEYQTGFGGTVAQAADRRAK